MFFRSVSIGPLFHKMLNASRSLGHDLLKKWPKSERHWSDRKILALERKGFITQFPAKPQLVQMYMVQQS